MADQKNGDFQLPQFSILYSFQLISICFDLIILGPQRVDEQCLSKAGLQEAGVQKLISQVIT